MRNMNDENFSIHKLEHLDSVINIVFAHRHFIGYIRINRYVQMNTDIHINGHFHTEMVGVKDIPVTQLTSTQTKRRAMFFVQGGGTM